MGFWKKLAPMSLDHDSKYRSIEFVNYSLRKGDERILIKSLTIYIPYYTRHIVRKWLSNKMQKDFY